MARADWRPYYGVVFEGVADAPLMSERMFLDHDQAHRVAKAWQPGAWGVKAVAVVAIIGRTAEQQRKLWQLASAPFIVPVE